MFRVLLSGLVGLALVLAGCGGDEETTALTKQQFLKQGNAICKAQADERENQVEEFAAKLDPTAKVGNEVQEKLMLQVLPTYEKATEELKALGAPEGDEKKLEAITQAMDEAAAGAREDPVAAARTKKPFIKANELSVEYGLDRCAA